MTMKPILKPIFPLDFNAIRKAIADEVEKVSLRKCILAEPETQNTPRPQKPYFTIKFLGPAGKTGDDSAQNLLDQNGNPTTVWNRGGQRKVTIDFNCYGTSHEEAYNYMALWQSSLELETIQEDLRRSGIALWLNGSVADLSALLNTGYEGRSQMSVEFGVASNLTEDLSSMDTVTVDGTITTDQNTTDDITVTVP